MNLLVILTRRWHAWDNPTGREPAYPLFTPYADPDPLMEWGATVLNDIAMAGMQAAATLFWSLEKVAAGITRFLIQADMWEVVLTSVLDSLKSVSPGILRELVFGASGGGLFYLALMLSGIFLMIPQLGKSRLVDPGQAIIWLVLLVTLFISTASGYDLIQAIETMRANTIRLLNPAGGDGLDDLIARPMRASDSDLETYELVLPQAFEADYFAGNRETQRAEILWGLEVIYETEASRTTRRDAARTGLALAALTLLPGITLLLFGVIFATLTAAALILITFFIVSLPLGFFEFGSQILMGIARQYVYLWAITLLAVILPSILKTAGTLTYPTEGAPNLTQLMSFMPVLVIVTIATSYVSAMATRTLSDTLYVVNTSVRSAMAPLAEYTGLPAQDTLSRAGSELSGIGVGVGNISAATMSALVQSRSVATALSAGAGATVANLAPTWGQAAATLARETVSSPRGDVFAAAADNPASKGISGTAQVAATAYHARFGRRTRRNEFLSGAGRAAPPARSSNHPQGTTSTEAEPTLDHPSRTVADAPTRLHLTPLPQERPASGVDPASERDVIMPTPYALQQANSFLVRQNDPLARADYYRLFGDSGLAEDLVAYHRQEGVRGMHLTQKVVAATQAVATERRQQGLPYLDDRGDTDPGVIAKAVQRLEAGGTVLLPEEAPLLERLMARAVYRSHSPAADIAPLVQAPDTLAGQARDSAAWFALHDIARHEGWNQEVIRDVVDATYYGHLSAEADNEQPTHRAARLLQQVPELRTLRGDERAEIARLTHLVLEDFAAQEGMPISTQAESEARSAPVSPLDVPGAGEVPLPVPADPAPGTPPPTVPEASRPSLPPGV